MFTFRFSRFATPLWCPLISALVIAGAATTIACRAVAAEPGAQVSQQPGPGSLTSPETLLADPARDPAWRELFDKLAPNKTRQSTFEERRYFPFRKAPVVLHGEIRIVPRLGLSLRYVQPEARVLIIDDKGLLMRDSEGREQSAPSDSRAQAATSALVHILRFDLDALKKEFEVHGRRDGATWTLAFVPRDPTFAELIGTLTVSGEQNALQKIEMIKSPTQRIEILIRDTREDVIFTGDTLKRFFR
jgi:hypothetical protein